MTHLLLYRFARPDEQHHEQAESLPFVPVSCCGAKWQRWSDLHPESRWPRIRCPECRKRARWLANLQAGLAKTEGLQWPPRESP